MTSNVDKQMYDFSVLRELRKRNGFSIQDVSERSGVSAAVISKMERNQTLAGLDTIYRISRVFGMNSSDMLSLVEGRSAHVTMSSEHTTHGIHFSEITYGNIKCLLGTAKAGDEVTRPEVHCDDYEICWVLQGHLEFVLPHERHELKKGEAIQFDAILEHTYKAVTDTKFLLIHLTKDKRF